MKKIIYIVIVSFLSLCTNAYDKNTTGMVVAGKTAIPPCIDGDLNDRCWTESIEITPFILSRQDQFAGEQTAAYITYDDQYLYLAFKCKESCLEPEGNRVHEFKNSESKKDSDGIWNKNDCVVFLLAPDIKKLDECYEFFINGAGTVSDARCQGKDLWESRDKTWDSGIRAAARSGNGVWTVEAAIPLKSLNIKPAGNTTCGIVLGRIEQSRNERSSWQPAAEGFHSQSSFAALKFVNATPGISNIKIPSFEPGNNSLQLEFQPVGQLNHLRISQHLQFIQGKNSIPVWKDFTATAPTQVSADFNLANSGELTYKWTYANPSTMELFFSSPAYRLSSSTSTIEADVKGGKTEIFVNGKSPVNGKAPLVKGVNVIAVKYDGDVSGGFNSNGYSIPLDSGWKYSANEEKGWNDVSFNDASWTVPPQKNGIVKGKGFLRKIVMSNESVIWPNWEKEGITMTRNGIQTLICMPRGVKGRELQDYTFYLEVPEDFTVKGASSYYNKYKIRFSGPEAILRNNRKFNRYSAVFDQKLTFNNALPIHEQFVFLVKAPVTEKNPGSELYFHAVAASGAISEIPQKLKINLLPELNGIQPKKIIVQMWPGCLHALSSQPMKEEIIDELIKMGVNESMMKLSGKLNQFLPFDFEPYCFDCTPYLKEHPDHAMLDSLGKAYPASKAYICPGRMLNDSVTQKYLHEGINTWLNKRGTIHNVVFDYEHSVFNGTLSCYCPRCLDTFKEKFAINAKLTPEIIKERYPKEWTSFMNARMAGIAGIIYSCIKQSSPQTNFCVYSSYQSEFTKRAYGVDWSLLKGKIDLAICGYGRSVKMIEDTLQAIGPEIPLATGLIVFPYDVAKREFPTFCSEAQIMQMLCDGTGGIMIYDMNALDGRTFSALGNVTKFVSEHEKFFTPMQKDRKHQIVTGLQEDNCVVLESDGKKLAILMNSSVMPKEFRLEASMISNVKRITDLSTGKESNSVDGTLAPGKIKGFILY